jgi:thioester reductase-like protein
MTPQGPEDSTLVTGFPSYTAKRMVLKLLGADPRERVFMLVRDKFSTDAEEFATTLPAAQRKRLTVLIGDVSSMDLGLSGREYRTMVGELTNIHHMAAHLHMSARKEIIQQVNVGGTRGTLELALECRRLRRFNFWSTIHVSGNREGVVMEDELACDQTFRNAYEHSKYAAEKIVRSMSRRVPSTIFRPGIIVGDSRTGEIDRFDGPYHLMVLIVESPLDLQLPLPGKGNAPLHLCPVDFVIDSAYHLSRVPTTVSKTFHLTDPSPLSARSVYQLVAERAHRRAPRGGSLPLGLARALLRLPGLDRLGGSPQAVLEGFTHNVFYNCRNTLDALRHTPIWCPPLESYVDNLVRYVKDVRAARRRRIDEEAPDPLDGSQAG